MRKVSSNNDRLSTGYLLYYHRIPVFLLFLYLALFPFGQLTRLPLPFGPEIRVYLTDLIAGILGLIGWTDLMVDKNKPASKLLLPIVAFAGAGLLSLVVNLPGLAVREGAIASLYLIRWIAYAGMFLAVRGLVLKRFLSGKLLGQSMVVAGSTIAVFGLIQYLLWPDLKPLEVFGWDPHFYRVVGTFLDPGFTGLILVFTFLHLFSEKDKRRSRLVIGGLVCLALALTYSRSAYLALWVSSLVLAWFRRKPKIAIAATLLLLVTVILIPRPAGEGGRLGRTYSVVTRFASWQQALNIFRENPVVGVGFNAYRYAARDYGFARDWQENHAAAGADASLIFAAVTTGIVGLTAYLWLGKTVLALSLRRKNGLLASVLAAAVIHSFFLNSLFYPWVMGWLWLVAVKADS